MHRLLFVAALAVFALALGASHAQAVTGPIYGLSFQWFRDADGDGIPNHLDDDWVRPEDGTGYQMKHGITSPTACSSLRIEQSRQAFRYMWRHHVKSPGLEADQIRDRIRDRLHDGTGDQVRLRLRDESCK